MYTWMWKDPISGLPLYAKASIFSFVTFISVSADLQMDVLL